MRTLVTKLLGPAQEIISSAGSPPRVQRWTVLRTKFFDVCIDHCDGEYVNRDGATDPDRFVSIGFGEAHTPENHYRVASFDDKAWMVLVRRHSDYVRGNAA